MMLPQRVCIVGLGLMGGSLALALRPFLAHLTIVESDAGTLAAARSLADAATEDLAAGVGQAEVVILATPVRTILGQLAELPQARPDGCMVLDLGSTKRQICRAMAALPAGFQAIGGHPMCGKESSGFAAAAPDLYQGQTFVLCRHGRTTPQVEKVAGEIISLIGARPLFLSPEEHDNLVGAVSHLPYVAAAVLMQTVAARQDERAWAVSASGWRDTARLAGSDPRVMLDIMLTNRSILIEHIGQYQAHLAGLKTLLLAGDEAGLADWLAEAQHAYAAYRQKK
jgi:prephenate dehydrogenase